MEVELGDYSRENNDLLRQLEQQELKLKATTKEMMKERQLVSVYCTSYYIVILADFVCTGARPKSSN